MAGPDFDAAGARTSDRVSPLNYADLRLNDGARRLKRVGVASIVIGLLSLVICAAAIFGEAAELSQITQDRRVRTEAFESEFGDRQDSAVVNSISAVFLLCSAVLLIAAGSLLYRLNPRGISLHRLYAAVQIIGCVWLSFILMRSIYNSPGGMLFYIGVIPGLIGCIYPIVVLSLLSPGGVKSAMSRD
jgi:hypothetical protein